MRLKNRAGTEVEAPDHMVPVLLLRGYVVVEPREREPRTRQPKRVRK